MITSFLMTWARILAEFGAIIMFAGNIEGTTQTMPLAIYTAMERNMSEATFLSLLMLVIVLVIMGMINWITRGEEDE